MHYVMIKKIILSLLSLFLLVLTLPNPAQAASAKVIDVKEVRFAAIGDTPYDKKESDDLRVAFERMSIHEIPFVIHIGDIFSSGVNSRKCVPAIYRERSEVFKSAPMPFMVTIGDHEFNECPDPKAAQVNFREIILDNPSQNQLVRGAASHFRPIQVARQPEMIENATWTFGKVDFVMLVFPDFSEPKLPSQDIKKILAADLVFVKERFKDAIFKKRDALVLMMHWNPFKCTEPGCNDFNTELKSLVSTFARPVLLINGNNHNWKFKGGNFQGVPHFSHLRPGKKPKKWAEVTYSSKDRKFVVKRHSQ